MPRGRPIKTDTTEDKRVNCYCELCNSPIYSSPTRILLYSLTGKASWHRDCNIEKAAICDKCASELNTIIDQFIIEKNPSLKKYN